jgi:predicted cupin superfamily sugar epimerase
MAVVNTEAQRIIAALGLEPLPREGGFFRQTWRSGTGSAIYFLLTPEDFSALHRLRADEVWHFYAGDAVEHVMLAPGDSAARVSKLGGDVLAGEVPQLVVPAGMWQGARLAARGTSTSLRAGWALLGCTLAPAWDEREFELGGRAELQRAFPAHAATVRALTR